MPRLCRHDDRGDGGSPRHRAGNRQKGLGAGARVAEPGTERMTNPESSDRWQRLGVLLGEALELAPELRAGYLDRECGDDPDLRAEMIALLAAHEGRGAVDHVADAVSETLPLRMESQAGRRVGPYRLVRVIDYGGMGAV